MKIRLKKRIILKKTLVIFIFFIFPLNTIDFVSNNNYFDISFEKFQEVLIIENTKDEFNAFLFDKSYNLYNSSFPINNDDYDDAGYRKDAGDEISNSFPLYPGEIIDIWPGRGRTGKLSSSDIEDWYFISVCKGQDIEITMTPPDGNNYDIGLWDDDEIERVVSTNTGSAIETLSFTADYTGFWFIRVHFISGSGEKQYSFTVILSGQNDANYGYDAGDSFNSATLLSTGTYEGYLDKNDEEDWYKFNVNKGQNIQFILQVKKYALLSDFDIYLYNPNGSMVHSENYYLDDELLYPIDESGYWRIKIKIFPGYTDIPKPTEWEYYTYGSGAYKLHFNIVSTVPDPPNPIPQAQIIPIAQTFNIVNDPDSNKDEYGYLAAIPACNFLENDIRFLSPIVYNGDNTLTNWFGTVDDTTGYLIDDWNSYLNSFGKTAFQYTVLNDPIKAAADIAFKNWASSDLAVVAIDGSDCDDTSSQVLDETKTLTRNTKVQIIPNLSLKIKKFGGSYFYPMALTSKWGAVNVSIYGPFIPGGGLFHIYPSLIQLCPKFMTLASDWWPKHQDEPRYDLYYPVTTPGLWAAGVKAPLGEWDFIITKYECHRYKINVEEPDSVLNVTITTTQPSDLIVFLIDPEGHIRAPDIPDWNGGPIKPIHEWNGIDDANSSNPCDPYREWNPGPHTEFSAEVLHPNKGKWEAIVVPRNADGLSDIKYTITGKIRILNEKRMDAAISAANAAVIASQEHVPLLYVKEDSVPSETQNVFNALNINNVIFVENNELGINVRDNLPNLVADLKSLQEIIDYIKDYPSSENYITITSLKTNGGFFAPAAMLAAYHGSPVLRIGDAAKKVTSSKNKKEISVNNFAKNIIGLISQYLPIQPISSNQNPSSWANRIDTWRLWSGDYYHGNRAPGHLPVHDEPVPKVRNFRLFIELIKFLLSGGNLGNLPPLGMDAKRYWNEEMYNGIYQWIEGFGLDLNGPEAFVFVAPRKDIRLEAHSIMMGNNSYSGHIPGKTVAYTSDIIVRNIMYPALIYANKNRNITSTHLINFPDGDSWVTNDGNQQRVESSRIIKNIFMTHKRIYEGHCLWDAHLERLNEGASIMYYAGHGTGGSGISAQYLQNEYCNYPEQLWPDAWRGYNYDYWQTARYNGLVWYNPSAPNLYDFIHYKWMDQILDNLRSNAIFYTSCSTGQHYGPLVYLDHGAVIWYGNAGSGITPEEDLIDDWFFEDAMKKGEPIGLAYSKYVWLHYRDFTTSDPASMYGPSTLHDVATIHCIYGDPNLILYSPDWISPIPIDSILEA
ncbi:MAG: hypothetical protein AYK22_08150 [Thermoplasmatales archaeon SG8-52-3]|nr:MAG: hypothetical protein AYK22_08150 [Thermoplasmatales archaeon SG8-52-3]